MTKKEVIDKTIELYNQKDWKSLFSRIRFWDAPYLEVEKLVPKKGVIVDLGCGEGIFTNFMAIAWPGRKVFGFELDAKRIREANSSLPNVGFKKADVTRVKIPKCDCIVMFHLLHHLLSFGAQVKLIERSVKSLNKNGKLVIVEVDKKPFLKYLISWLTDHFIVAWLFEKKFFEKNIYFRDRKEWEALFKRLQISFSTIQVHRRKPFSHIAFVCTKK